MIGFDEIAYTRYCFVHPAMDKHVEITAKNIGELDDKLLAFGDCHEFVCLFAVPVMKSEVADAFKVTPDQVMSNDKIKEVSDGNS